MEENFDSISLQCTIFFLNSTTLIFKGNKSKRRDSVLLIIMLQHMFYCCGFNTSKMHSLGTPKWLTSGTRICFKWPFPILLAYHLPPPGGLAFLVCMLPLLGCSLGIYCPKESHRHLEIRWKLICGSQFSPAPSVFLKISLWRYHSTFSLNH